MTHLPHHETAWLFVSTTSSDDVELHVISLTYKDLAGLSRRDKSGKMAIDKATFLQNFPVPGLAGGEAYFTR